MAVNGASRNNLLVFGGKWIGGLQVNVVHIYCPHRLVSALRGRFDYITLRFCGLLLGFVGDCTITLSGWLLC